MTSNGMNLRKAALSVNIVLISAIAVRDCTNCRCWKVRLNAYVLLLEIPWIVKRFERKSVIVVVVADLKIWP